MMQWICDKCGQPNSGDRTFIVFNITVKCERPIRGVSTREVCSKCFLNIDEGWTNKFLVEENPSEAEEVKK